MADNTTSAAVLFDIDGTLVDSNYLHVHAWTRAFDEVGGSVDAWRIHRAIGMDGNLLIESLLDADDATRRHAKDLHSEYYLAGGALLRTLPGARDLLARVTETGLQLVLATSAPEDELSLLRKVLGMEEIVSAVTSSEDVESAKPRPDVVRVALERAGVGAERAAFVGDTVWDGKACAEAGVPFVAVLSGGISAAELTGAGAVAVYDDPAHLLARFDSSPLTRLLRD